MEYIKIGKIVNTRGIRGELKVKPLTDFQSDRYKLGNSVYVLYQNKYLEFKVKKYNNHKNQDLLTFIDNEDINLVEKYKGCYIYVSSDSETTLYEDEYHLSEIIDIDVVQANKHIGKVSDVKEYPQGDYLVVETLEGEKKLVPFRDEFVLDVDLENNSIEIIEMEGLL